MSTPSLVTTDAPQHPPSLRFRRAITVLTASIPAFVLVLAGIAKYADSYPSARFVSVVLHMPIAASIYVTRAVAGGEIILGCALCVVAGVSIVPAWLATGLFAVFCGLLVRLLIVMPNAATCGCFGSLFNDFAYHSLWTQVALDGLLVCVLALHVALAAKLCRDRRGARQP